MYGPSAENPTDKEPDNNPMTYIVIGLDVVVAVVIVGSVSKNKKK